MIPVAGFEGLRVGVVGMGRSGLAAARALRAGGAVPVCWDDGEAGRAKAAAEGFEVAILTESANAESLARVILSPGVPHLHPAPHPAVEAAWAAGAPLDNDVGLFFRAVQAMGAGRPKVVAITGTNGKSTTTALVAHILAQAGRRAQAGGNIGRPVLDLDPPAGVGDGRDVYVVELSSYQTDVAATLAPDVAIFTNLTPDHLDRHGGPGGYFAAKRRLFDDPDMTARVIGVEEAEGRFLANGLAGLPGETIQISANPETPPATIAAKVAAASGALTAEIPAFDAAPVTLPLTGAPALKGAHNWQNAAAAYAACRALGVAPEQIAVGFDSFPGLPHRLQRVAEADGVVFVNDSKATNAEAAAKALSAYDKVRWILGGRAKEGGIEGLRPLFGKVAKAYLIGEATEQFAKALRVYPEEVPYERCGDLATAVARAAAEAEAGEAVLLAPACASFDQFPDFEKRGEAFIAAVNAVLTERAQG